MATTAKTTNTTTIEKRKPLFIKVEELKPGTSGHNLTVKVVNSKAIPPPKPRRGPSSLSQRPLRPSRITECLVGDETGTISLSLDGHIAEAARRCGILAIAVEVYMQFTFGSKPFVPMATFGSIAPVVTVGSISKEWVVPGWPLGWLVTCDPHGNLQKSGIVQHISACLRIIISPPVTFLQGALPKILQEREGTFFLQHMKGLRKVWMSFISKHFITKHEKSLALLGHKNQKELLAEWSSWICHY